MRKILTFFIGIFCVSCCDSVPSKDVVAFDLSEITEDVKTSGVIKDYNIVKLEGGEDCLIGVIDKVIRYNDRIYVADLNNTRSVYIFDENGKFINKISRQGRSNSEYTQLSTIFIDKKNGSLNLLTRNPSKILSFDPDGVNAPQVVELNKNLVDVELSDDTYLGFAGNVSNGKSRNIWTFNKNGEVLGDYLDIPKGWESSYSITDVFSSYADALYYLSAMDYKIYKYSRDNTFEPILTVDFGDYNWPTDIVTYEQLHENPHRNFIKDIDRFQECSDYWLFHFIHNGQNVIGIYSKTDNSTNVYNIASNTDKYFLPFGDIKSIDEKYIITAIDAADMNKYMTGKDEYNDFTEEYSTQIARLNSEIKQVHDNDNPVLLFYELR